MCFIVCKTTLELERVILTTLYLTGAKKHRQGSILSEDNSPTSCVLVLLGAIDVVVALPPRVPLPLILYQGGEVIRKVTESIISSRS
jgi:hypothetical protein